MKWDGRLVVGMAVSLWLTVALFGMFMGHGEQVWRRLGVYSGPASYLDARVITKACDNVRAGHDAYDLLPGSTPQMQMRFNYPRVWLLLRYCGLGEQNTVKFGCAEALFFYVCAFLLMGRLTMGKALVYTLVLCSPAAMLAVERGNCDLVVFGLIAIAVMLAARRYLISASVLCFAAVLKLFPIFALLMFLRENKRRAFTVLAIFGFLFSVYVLATMPDIVQVRAATPRPTMFGFGCMTLVDGAGKWLVMHGHEDRYSIFLRKVAFLTSLGIAFISAWFGLKQWRPGLPPSVQLDAFRAGAFIYIGVFLIGNNYEYRLIFLILCVGQLLVWFQQDARFRRAAALAVLALLVSAWERLPMAYDVPGNLLFFFPAQIAHWTLFALLVWFIAATLPDWLVEMIPDSLRKGGFSDSGQMERPKPMVTVS